MTLSLAGPVKIPLIICYVIGFLVEIPFVNTTLYEGPLSKTMGGGDVS